MGELYEERRQEPRFPTNGKYRLQRPRAAEIEGKIIDLSLNGALLELGASTQLEAGVRCQVSLEFPGLPPFSGDVMLVRLEPTRLGVEFYDMDPQNFAALTALIDALKHRRR